MVEGKFFQEKKVLLFTFPLLELKKTFPAENLFYLL